ncbi:hypothetical protein [Nocardia sp. NPDC057455]|uniref:hypothetical protein n=1 Tax=Nocardia sp. NPDC057455 TaxID=3346138 RepID=UPI0036709A49
MDERDATTPAADYHASAAPRSAHRTRPAGRLAEVEHQRQAHPRGATRELDHRRQDGRRLLRLAQATSRSSGREPITILSRKSDADAEANNDLLVEVTKVAVDRPR